MPSESAVWRRQTARIVPVLPAACLWAHKTLQKSTASSRPISRARALAKPVGLLWSYHHTTNILPLCQQIFTPLFWTLLSGLWRCWLTCNSAAILSVSHGHMQDGTRVTASVQGTYVIWAAGCRLTLVCSSPVGTSMFVGVHADPNLPDAQLCLNPPRAIHTQADLAEARSN